ncbi:hypothetical protein SK128_008204 [Halocaridina rubra]|uniref:Uncharacterized protein n=1 Tax=Halocaridina rubra TaxID=373956 RepID=A0AAN8WMX4_HALRR
MKDRVGVGGYEMSDKRNLESFEQQDNERYNFLRKQTYDHNSKLNYDDDVGELSLYLEWKRNTQGMLATSCSSDLAIK